MMNFNLLNKSFTRYRARTWLLVGGLVTVALFSIMGGYALRESRAQYLERGELLSQNLAAASEHGLSATVEKIDLAISTVASHLNPDLVSAQGEALQPDGHRAVQMAKQSGLEEIQLVDAQGQVIHQPTEDSDRSNELLDRQGFNMLRDQPLAGLSIAGPVESRRHRRSMLLFSRRYTDAQGRFAGVVTAAVPAEFFANLLSEVGAGPHGTVVLCDNNLALLVRYPGPSGKMDAAADHTELSGLRDASEAKDWHTLTYRAAAAPDGETRTYTAHRLRSAPLTVLVGLAEKDLLAGWMEELHALVIFVAGVAGLYGCGSWFLLHTLSQGRKTRKRLALLAKVFEHSGEAIVLTDKTNHIIEVNPSFVQQTGYQPEEVIGRDPKLLAAGRTPRAVYESMWQAIKTQGIWRGELWDRAKDGQEYLKWMSITVLRNAQGEITHHLGSFVDMTEVKQAEDRIRHVAHHDTLTRLPNRMHLHGQLEQAMARARRDGTQLAMLFIDMDRFKNINDTLGHPVGDRFLVGVAERLRGVVRDSDIVARLGGDEFVLVLTGLAQDAVGAAGAVAAKVRTELSRPFLVDSHELHSTPSIGVSMFPADGDDADTLMKNADTAMYHAKAAGRDNFQFFTPAMNQATAERLALEVGLRSAVQSDELLLHYQPQVSLDSGCVVGVEALVRWRHPERGLIPPAKFVPVAEETGQIQAIGRWVLDRALAQVAAWRRGGLVGLRVAVNMSAHQMRGSEFVMDVAQGLRRHGLQGDALELEVTESVAMRNPEQTAVLLRQLRELGVALAIDDFGTGYSSLAYLKQLPLSCLKLDRSFVKDIEHDPNDAAISTAAIQLAHSLGLTVVAEGVENAEQMAFLRRLHCDTAQGYYIGRPMPAEDCGEFMHAAKSGQAFSSSPHRPHDSGPGEAVKTRSEVEVAEAMRSAELQREGGPIRTGYLRANANPHAKDIFGQMAYQRTPIQPAL